MKILFVFICFFVGILLTETIHYQHERLREKIKLRATKILSDYDEIRVDAFLEGALGREIRYLASLDDKEFSEYLCNKLGD
ncbi:MAG: hypothetical protein E7020_03305 [Alphaproteobacteria bacterium]|nr:hypothetical protein [Alphaproteobacteria bacterium]